jgi:hypothetical protein
MTYGPQTYEQFMDEYYAEEMAKAYGPPERLPVAPPAGWDWDLWSEFRAHVEADRRERRVYG